ncbi:hypothetical protein BDN72DRAFT_899331 [Pluteus cervinus]|uniref:Uncharacterized protein n=1 Tax=Pluteus cervinus TaxID=181527 RepID=A0ACD3ANE0_9AGAR|nr:hypothetical protein BDN72DRAFT_899331 [Pluteus cervinus]
MHLFPHDFVLQMVIELPVYLSLQRTRPRSSRRTSFCQDRYRTPDNLNHGEQKEIDQPPRVQDRCRSGSLVTKLEGLVDKNGTLLLCVDVQLKTRIARIATLLHTSPPKMVFKVVEWTQIYKYFETRNASYILPVSQPYTPVKTECTDICANPFPYLPSPSIFREILMLQPSSHFNFLCTTRSRAEPVLGSKAETMGFFRQSPPPKGSISAAHVGFLAGFLVCHVLPALIDSEQNSDVFRPVVDIHASMVDRGFPLDLVPSMIQPEEWTPLRRLGAIGNA